jgi:hypothetical protein
LSQLIINKIPIRNAGPAIIRELFINIITTYNVPAKIKVIPPTISRFQDINRTIDKTNTGILCINNPNAVSQKPNFISKTSKENIAKNSIKMIDKILGVQYTNLLIFFSILLAHSTKKPPDWQFFEANSPYRTHLEPLIGRE